VVIATTAAVVWVICTRGGMLPNYTMVSTSAPPAPPAIPLAPNDRGYVRVETKSGSVRCSVTSELVACQTSATNWPPKPDGRPFRTVSVNRDGEFNWVNADLGALEGRVTLDHQTYSAQGWTISVSQDRTTFTNDRTSHGMAVSDQHVEPF
jgi:hypothetical protein